MSTDEISTSLSYSREVTKIGKHAKVTQSVEGKDPHHSLLPRTHVGVDPGKKNLIGDHDRPERDLPQIYLQTENVREQADEIQSYSRNGEVQG